MSRPVQTQSVTWMRLTPPVVRPVPNLQPPARWQRSKLAASRSAHSSASSVQSVNVSSPRSTACSLSSQSAKEAWLTSRKKHCPGSRPRFQSTDTSVSARRVWVTVQSVNEARRCSPVKFTSPATVHCSNSASRKPPTFNTASSLRSMRTRPALVLLESPRRRSPVHSSSTSSPFTSTGPPDWTRVLRTLSVRPAGTTTSPTCRPSMFSTTSSWSSRPFKRLPGEVS